MTTKPQVPVLTDVIAADAARPRHGDERAAQRLLREDSEVVVEASRREVDSETVIAELQTRLAASAFELTDDILRKAFADLEASLHEQISARLRRELPELIDALLREHLQNR